MHKMNVLFFSLLVISISYVSVFASGIEYKIDPKKKNAPIIIKFSGTIIDNISLKNNKDSLSVFLPKLKKQTLIDNAKSGYSIYLSTGKLYNLKHQSTESLWNTFRNMKSSTFKISGNAQRLADSLLILDYVCQE